MITLGMHRGGPEEIKIGKVWQCLACRIGDLRGGEVEEWEDTVAGINVVYYVPASIMRHETVTRIEVARYSRKRKLVLVNVPVPAHLVNDASGGLAYMVEALHTANRLAADAFRKKGETFDFDRAESIVAAAAAACSGMPETE